MKAAHARSPLTSYPTSPQRLPPLTPLTTDCHRPFQIPRTEPDADGMLATAEWRIANQPTLRLDVARDLSRFLGSSGRVWTPARRERLQRLLVSVGSQSLSAVFAVAAASPREEVIDAVVSVVAASADADTMTTLALIDVLLSGRSAFAFGDAPIVREVIARALARSTNPFALQSRVRVLLILAGSDPSSAVRDAVIQTLAMVDEPKTVAARIDILRKLQATEADPLVQRSFAEALETLEER